MNTLSGHLPDLEKSGEGLTAEDVERLAGKAMADDFYYRNGDEVGSGVSVTLQTE
ncbi:hypothetical protein SJ05684_b55810 (plasmid) [Sinorhizobium sojae CCBAU 05684]|uniref:Uncharacterized protein n=1 Tax=Sinorhizobium sojae CCBAU 05684 TaxID=716928 RepID=A0A249PKV8_9HYPH|nr:hypothetical protein SJ05684_b55810 [Sinorhizobium sojae CCBAU 05684]